MVNGDGDASAVRQFSSGGCVSARLTCGPTGEPRVMDRKAPSGRPPLVVDHGLSF